MDGLIRILIMLFLLLTGTRQPAETPPEPEATFQSPTQIESVEAILLESYPVQIHLNVMGYQPDGCDFPVQVVQQRDGNTVTVQIFRDVPVSVMCPAMLVNYSDTIALEGGFESGSYTILVNDYALEVTI